MKNTDITITRQVECVTEIVGKCAAFSVDLQKLQAELSELQVVRDEELSSIDRANQSSLEVSLWDLNLSQVRSVLNGSLAHSRVDYIELFYTDISFDYLLGYSSYFP